MKNIDIDINMVILENIDINIDILKSIDIDKGILQNIDIIKISYQFEFDISNRARFSGTSCPHHQQDGVENLYTFLLLGFHSVMHGSEVEAVIAGICQA